MAFEATLKRWTEFYQRSQRRGGERCRERCSERRAGKVRDIGTAEDASLSHLQVTDGAVEEQKGSLEMC